MKRIRQWLLTGAVALALLLSLGQAVSADPGGTPNGGYSGGGATTTSEPGDGGFQ